MMKCYFKSFREKKNDEKMYSIASYISDHCPNVQDIELDGFGLTNLNIAKSLWA